MPSKRYVFDDPDARRRERERLAAVVASERLAGNYSVETYRERAAASRGPVTTPEERERSRAFNRKWRRHLNGTCAAQCYWCGTLVPRTETKEPERLTTPRLAENAIFR